MVDEQDSLTRVRFTDTELNGLDIRDLVEQVGGMIDHLEQSRPHVVIDFDGVTYMPSAGLSLLVFALKKLRQRGGQMRLTNLTPKLRELIEVSRLDTLFEIDPGADGGSDADR